MSLTLHDLKSQANALKVEGADDTFIGQVLQRYSQYIADQLLGILDRVPFSVDLLHDFLKTNWALVKKTRFGYTAMPKASVTKLLCNVAVYCSDRNPETQAIQYLMPDVCIESLDAVNTYVLQISAVSLQHVLSTHIINDAGDGLLPLTLLLTEDLMDVTTESRYSASEIERMTRHSAETAAIKVACEGYRQHSYRLSPLLGQLQHLCRILQFDPLDEAIAQRTYDAITDFYGFYRTLNEETKNTIPPLLKLEIEKMIAILQAWRDTRRAALLTWEDEIDAGTGELSCVNLEANGGAGGFSIEISGVLRCIENLARAMIEYKTVLIEMGGEAITDASQSMLLQQAQQRLYQTQQALELTLKTPETMTGSDSLSINSDVLAIIGFSLTFSSREHLKIFDELSVAEIEGLLQDPRLVNELASYLLSNFRVFLLFCRDMPLPKLSVLLQTLTMPFGKIFLSSPRLLAVLPKLLEAFNRFEQEGERFPLLLMPIKAALLNSIRTPADFGRLFRSLSPIHCTDLCHELKNHLLGIIQNVGDLAIALQDLPVAQGAAVCSALGEQRSAIIRTAWNLAPTSPINIFNTLIPYFSSLIKNHEDFCYLMQRFTPVQRGRVCQELEKDLIELVTDASQLASILQLLTVEQGRSLMFKKDKPKPYLLGCVKHVGDLANIVRFFMSEQRIKVYKMFQHWQFLHGWDLLAPEECDAAFEILKRDAHIFIRDGDAFYTIMEHITPEQRTELFEILQEVLPSFVNYLESFGSVFAFLTPEQWTVMFNAIRERFPEFINTCLNFYTAIEWSPREQHEVLIETVKTKLPLMTKTVEDLRNIFALLSLVQSVEICETLQEQWPTIITSSAALTVLLNSFEYEKRRVILFEALKYLPLDRIIKSGRDILDILSLLKREECDRFCDQLGSRFILLTMLASSDDFEQILRALSPDKQDDIRSLLLYRQGDIKSLLPLMHNHSLRALAIALFDHNEDRIKTEMTNLCHSRRSSVAFFVSDPISLIEDCLDVRWIRVINRAFELDCTDLAQAQWAALKDYVRAQGSSEDVLVMPSFP